MTANCVPLRSVIVQISLFLFFEVQNTNESIFNNNDADGWHKKKIPTKLFLIKTTKRSHSVKTKDEKGNGQQILFILIYFCLRGF